MSYSILVYESPAGFAARTDAKQQEGYWSGVMHYLKALKDAGVFVSGAGLQLPETATTLQHRDGKRLVQDRPFADTKEQLGGFFVINVPNLDAALEWGARFPHRPGQLVEVRPNLPEEIPVRG